MSEPWLKLWWEILDDPKIFRLSLITDGRWQWVALLLLCKKGNNGNKVSITKDTPYSTMELAYRLGVEEEDCKTFLEEARKLNLISIDKKGFISILNWEKWQYSRNGKDKKYYESTKENGKLTTGLRPDSDSFTTKLRPQTTDSRLQIKEQHACNSVSNVDGLNSVVVNEMMNLGLTPKKISSLISKHSLEEIKAQLDYLPYRSLNNPSGGFIRALEGKWEAPVNYPSPSQTQDCQEGDEWQERYSEKTDSLPCRWDAGKKGQREYFFNGQWVNEYQMEDALQKAEELEWERLRDEGRLIPLTGQALKEEGDAECQQAS